MRTAARAAREPHSPGEVTSARDDERVLAAAATAVQDTPPMQFGADHLQGVLDALPGAVVVLGSDGRIEQFNPAAHALLGDALLGRAWREVVRERFVPGAVGPDARLHDGRWVSVTTRSLEPMPGQVLLLGDVTDMRERELQLRSLQRVADTGGLLAALAHQIRTPLAAAILDASSLRGVLVPERVGYAASRTQGRLLDRLRRLERLVEDILRLARNDQLDIAPCDLTELLEWFATREGPARADGIRLSVRNLESPAMVLASPDALGSVLDSLVRNAAQACAGQGEITVEARRSANALSVVVSDTGPGVPTALAERVFEPFFTTRPDGHGLGLAIARTIVEAHHGSLRLDPSVAGGATFTLTLPRSRIACEPRRCR